MIHLRPNYKISMWIIIALRLSQCDDTMTGVKVNVSVYMCTTESEDIRSRIYGLPLPSRGRLFHIGYRSEPSDTGTSPPRVVPRSRLRCKQRRPRNAHGRVKARILTEKNLTTLHFSQKQQTGHMKLATGVC